MQRLEVSSAVRPICGSLSAKGLKSGSLNLLEPSGPVIRLLYLYCSLLQLLVLQMNFTISIKVAVHSIVYCYGAVLECRHGGRDVIQLFDRG
jgi:hypothetical protein